jgi:hypothetical protein
MLFKEYLDLISYNGQIYDINPFFLGFHQCLNLVSDPDLDPDLKPQVRDPDPTKISDPYVYGSTTLVQTRKASQFFA